MFKHREIKEKDLPLSILGKEEKTFKSVYKLTGLLDSDIHLSLKFNGYICRKAALQSGEVVENGWVK